MCERISLVTCDICKELTVDHYDGDTDKQRGSYRSGQTYGYPGTEVVPGGNGKEKAEVVPKIRSGGNR